MGRSISGQVTLAMVSSRQCRAAAICSNAGCHIAAWESPTRATVVAESGSPEAHSAWPTSRQDRTQPFTNTSALLPAASASEGVRFEGTGPIAADAAMAACACASCCRTAASPGSVVGVTGAAGAVRASAGAAVPRPAGTGTSTSSTSATPPATAVIAPPQARLRAAEPRKGTAKRAGFSTSHSVSMASPPASVTAPSEPPSPSGCPTTQGASNNTGQCHRYHE